MTARVWSPASIPAAGEVVEQRDAVGLRPMYVLPSSSTRMCLSAKLKRSVCHSFHTHRRVRRRRDARRRDRTATTTTLPAPTRWRTTFPEKRHRCHAGGLRMCASNAYSLRAMCPSGSRTWTPRASFERGVCSRSPKADDPSYVSSIVRSSTMPAGLESAQGDRQRLEVRRALQ